MRARCDRASSHDRAGGREGPSGPGERLLDVAALLWGMPHDDAEQPVSVRRHGRALELRVGMYCASVYAPGEPLTHAYWDLLALPLLLLPERPRCLMLGLGAGTGARLLRALAADARIVGVELSSQVIEAARREFELDALGVELVLGDAHDLLLRDSDSYELIIEDIFVDRGGVAHKPAWLPEPGLELAAARLAAGGVLVSNTLSESRATAATLRRLFAHVLRAEMLDCDNQVYIASHAPLDAVALRSAIERHELLAPSAAYSSIQPV